MLNKIIVIILIVIVAFPMISFAKGETKVELRKAYRAGKRVSVKLRHTGYFVPRPNSLNKLPVNRGSDIDFDHYNRHHEENSTVKSFPVERR